MGFFLDFFSGKMGIPISDNTAIDQNGKVLMKISDDFAVSTDTGELHFLCHMKNKNNGIGGMPGPFGP